MAARCWRGGFLDFIAPNFIANDVGAYWLGLEVIAYYISDRPSCQVKNWDHCHKMPSQPARKPVNTYHHGGLRDALVQAALREAERGGPEAISLKALAKELGVSQPAPYRQFWPIARRCLRR